MRFRMGKGQVLVFDEYVEKKLEKLRNDLGYYPSLREIANNCIPPTRADFVYRSLRRLAAANRLPKEALSVYNAKNNQKNITGEKTDEKRTGSKIKK
jgi:hypothetical protein